MVTTGCKHFHLNLLKQLQLNLDGLGKTMQNINGKFNSNTELVYRDFKACSITANETPTKNEVEEFWKSIWENETKFNKNAKWLKELEKTYCRDVAPKTYKL